LSTIFIAKNSEQKSNVYTELQRKNIGNRQATYMGIINATPDSFFGGSRFNGVDEIVAKQKKC
jgi:dihydropteroate synthase